MTEAGRGGACGSYTGQPIYSFADILNLTCLSRHQVRTVTGACCSCGHWQLFSVSYLIKCEVCQPTKEMRADDAATGLKLAAAGIAAAALLHAAPAFAGVVFDKKPETKKVC